MCNFYISMILNGPQFHCTHVELYKQYHRSPHNTFINMARSKLYAYQLFMQLLHTPWSIIFIMYEDSTVAPRFKMLREKNNHTYIKRHAR